jgi:hypothetical protein
MASSYALHHEGSNDFVQATNEGIIAVFLGVVRDWQEYNLLCHPKHYQN